MPRQGSLKQASNVLKHFLYFILNGRLHFILSVKMNDQLEKCLPLVRKKSKWSSLDDTLHIPKENLRSALLWHEELCEAYCYPKMFSFELLCLDESPL